MSIVLANSKASSLLNLSDHFLSRSEILESVEEVVGLPWSVVEVVGGGLEEDFTDLSDLAGLVDVEDFLLSTFLDFFSAGPLKPEVVWPSTTPTTDTSAGSTRVGLRVSTALAGVDDLASFLSFLSLYEGVDNWAFCSEDKASQCEQAASGVSMQGSEPFF